MLNVPPGYQKWLMVAATAALAFLAFHLGYSYVIPGLLDTFWGILSILLPFIIALALTAFLEPLIDFTEEYSKLPRGLVVLIVLAVLLVVITLLIFVVGGFLMNELLRLTNRLPHITENLIATTQYWLTSVVAVSEALHFPEQTLVYIEESVQELAENIRQYTTQAVNWMAGFFAGLPITFLKIIITFVAAFFFMRDGRKFIALMHTHLPYAWADKIEFLGSTFGAAIVRYVRAVSILITITFFLSWIGLSLISIEFAFAIAIITGILDIFPIVGPGLIYIPWVIICFATGEIGLGLALLLLYGFLVVFRAILEPKVIGDSIGLHPLETLIALFAGIMLLGPAGLIIVPIAWLFAKAAYKENLLSKEG